MFSLVLAGLGFASTTAIGGAPLFFLVVLAALFRWRVFANEFSKRVVVFAVCWSILGYAAYAYNGTYAGALDQTGSAGLALPFMCALGFLALFSVDRRYINWILIFFAVEVLVGFVEYYLGVRSVLGVEFKGETEMGEVDYLYSNRVFGLSLNSSVFAAKVLFGLVLLCLLKYKKRICRWHYLVFLIYLSAFYINFSRTAFIAAIFSVAIFLWLHDKRILVAGCVLGVLGTIPFSDVLFDQFNRGGGSVDYSGRDAIFPIYLDFISKNLFFGNFGFKYYVIYDGLVYHAHNSYLQVASTSGLPFLIALLSMALFFSRFILLLICFPIFMYSGFQYGVFWGASLYDQLFWFVLLAPQFKTFWNNSWDSDRIL